jgi:hypothetical protein
MSRAVRRLAAAGLLLAAVVPLSGASPSGSPHRVSREHARSAIQFLTLLILATLRPFLQLGRAACTFTHPSERRALLPEWRPLLRARRLALLGAVASAALAASALPSSASTVFGSGAPVFAVSEAPSDLPDVDTAGEPSVGIDWRTGAGLYKAALSTYKLGLDGTTGTVTWTNVTPASGWSVNIDPVLVTEPRSGLTLSGGDTTACSLLFATSDDGGSWLPSVPCTGTYDHPTVGWSPSAKTPGSIVFYYCQQGPDLQQCSTSTDGGTTWVVSGPSVQAKVPSTSDFTPHFCLGVFGHLRGSADGTAYLPGKSCVRADGSSGVGGMQTGDDGTTWTEYLVPGASSGGFDPAVATTPDNTVYEAWQNATDNHPVIAVSHDHGGTWSTPIDVASAVPGLVASTLPTLTAGDNGRLAYSFLGSSIGTGNPNAAGFHGAWYLYTAYTYDGGTTWTAVKDTSTPVQYGYISNGGSNSTGGRNLLDFIESAATKDGRVVVSFVDGCLAACEAATSQSAAEALSTHAWASVALQTGGNGLFAAYDTP